MSLMGFGGDTALMGGGFAAVPEPATWVLVAVGALCVAAWRRHASGWAAYLS
jgi:hypothetical protein